MYLILIGLILMAAAIAILRIHEIPPFASSPDTHSEPEPFQPMKKDPPVAAPSVVVGAAATEAVVVFPGPASQTKETALAPEAPAHAEIAGAPPYPSDEVLAMPEGLPPGWLCLKGSAKGHQKEVLQDAHALRIVGDRAILIVADGAGSKPCSKAGADHAVAHVMGGLEARIDSIGPEQWPEVAKGILLDAAKSLKSLADSEGKPVGDYSCTLIVLMATDTHVLCAHVGDGRAGYLDAEGFLRAAMVPYKGQEANSTVFLGMLTAENAKDYLRAHVYPVRSRALVALSDGPENVCWHTATLDQEGRRLVDPNKPAASFFGKIVMQLAGAAAAKVPPDELDAKWCQFLESGNSMLAEERDDKTLLFAMRG